MLKKMKEIIRIIRRKSSFLKCTTVLSEHGTGSTFCRTGGDTGQKCGNSAPQVPGGLESSNKKLNRCN